MKRALQLAGVAALLSLAFLFAALGVTAVRVGRVVDARTAAIEQRLSRSLDSVDALAATAKDTAATQSVYWKATSLQTSRLLGQWRHLTTNLDASLNDPQLGLLPNARDGIKDTHETLKQARESIDLLQGQTIELAAAGTATLNESTRAAHNAAEILGDRHLHEALVAGAESAKNVQRGTDALASVLEDLRHPEKPAKWLRALSIALQILRGTALAGQSAPVFGR